MDTKKLEEGLKLLAMGKNLSSLPNPYNQHKIKPSKPSAWNELAAFNGLRVQRDFMDFCRILDSGNHQVASWGSSSAMMRWFNGQLKKDKKMKGAIIGRVVIKIVIFLVIAGIGIGGFFLVNKYGASKVLFFALKTVIFGISLAGWLWFMMLMMFDEDENSWPLYVGFLCLVAATAAFCAYFKSPPGAILIIACIVQLLSLIRGFSRPLYTWLTFMAVCNVIFYLTGLTHYTVKFNGIEFTTNFWIALAASGILAIILPVILTILAVIISKIIAQKMVDEYEDDHPFQAFFGHGRIERKAATEASKKVGSLFGKLGEWLFDRL